MPKNSAGLHHFHVRKRIHVKHEQYPHQNKWVNLMDKLIYLVGVIGPIMTVPQLYEVWSKKAANSLSLVTWASWTVLSCFWLVYAIMHKSWPLIISEILWVIVEAGVLAGIIIYR